MNIVNIQQIDLTHYGLPSHPCVFELDIQISSAQIPIEAMKIITWLQDTSWLATLDDIDKANYLACAEPTIRDLCNMITNEYLSASYTPGNLKDDLGEYLVSMNAQEALVQGLTHTKIPIAELWKEQIKGNPGFDFHTLSTSDIIVYGEAKYKSTQNGYYDAFNQIRDFINDHKMSRELRHLRVLATENAARNVLTDQLGFAAAFSVNTRNLPHIIENAIKYPTFSALLNYPEVYLITVEIV